MTFQCKTAPWPHQRQALAFAAARPATMLALDMGTGKSKVLIDLLENKNLFPALILCPKSVVAVWPLEFARHGRHPHSLLALDQGTTKTRTETIRQAFALQEAKPNGLVVIVNYEAVIVDPLASELCNHQWAVVALDESHRIKAPGGKTSWLCKALGQHAQYRLCLTGTPLPHSPLDVYAQYRFLDPTIFGSSFVRFRARYALMGGYNAKHVTGYQHLDELEVKMKTIMVRVKSEDVQHLPEQIDTVRYCTFKPATLAAYRRLQHQFVLALNEGTVTAGNALTRLLRLQQMTSGYLRTDDEDGSGGRDIILDSAKTDLLHETIADLPEQEPVIVFCRFVHDLDMVQQVGVALGRTTGELSGRANNLEEFQNKKISMLAVQIQSGGVGIDLTVARYCLYYSLGFSLGDYLQSRKRVHRPGQSRSVTYIHLLVKHTVDERVMAALQARQEVIDSILEGGL